MHLRYAVSFALALTAAACGKAGNAPQPHSQPHPVDPGAVADYRAEHERVNASRVAAIVSDVLTDLRCKAELEQTLQTGCAAPADRQWSRVASPGRDGSISLVSATADSTEMVLVRRFLNREAEVECVSADRTVRYRFAVDRKDPALDTCKVSHNVVRRELGTASADQGAVLSDAHIKSLLAENELGVIYVWSPHMPFSYSSKQDESGANGVANIRKAVANASMSLGAPVSLTIAVDPNAQPALVDSIVAEEEGLDSTMTAPADALGLFLRQSNHHYPAMFVYADGKLSAHVFPGVETVDKYGAVIVGQIQSLRGQ